MAQPVIIFGSGGQVGQALINAAPRFGMAPIAFTSSTGNLTNRSQLKQILDDHPEVPVINAAAYTGVDSAEEDRDTAFAINATGPAWIAELAGRDREVFHYSTDYVFDGTADQPYTVDHPTHPLGVYGASKLEGEAAILMHPKGTVIRTAWVYSATGKNFLKTMLRVGRERGALNVVEDQLGTPTHATDIAEATYTLLKANATPGLYHYTADGHTSWYGFAAKIFDALKVETGAEVALTAIPSTAYPTPAARPAYSVLEGSKIAQIKGIIRPHWTDRIPETVSAVLAEKGAM